MSDHRVVRIWQERWDEVSWRCSCGFVHKHQLLDQTGSVEVGPCPDSRPPEPTAEQAGRLVRRPPATTIHVTPGEEIW